MGFKLLPKPELIFSTLTKEYKEDQDRGLGFGSEADLNEGPTSLFDRAESGWYPS
jgi:hypothetical protein